MSALLRGGGTTARELAAAHLDAAEREYHALNAWLSIDRDRALEEADAADARFAAARGAGDAAIDALHPLLGIPVALKDLISVAGGQCTAGSRILEGYIAPYDAHIVERLRDAGAECGAELMPEPSRQVCQSRCLRVRRRRRRGSAARR